MARPNLQETKIEHGQEWETLHPITEPVDPSRVKMILTAARQGELGRLHRLYEMMRTDDRFGGVISSLKRAIAAKRVRVSPSKHFRNAEEERTAREYADRARFLMQDLSMRKVLKGFTLPYLKGVEGYEIDYERRDAPFFGSRAYFVSDVETIPTTRLHVGRDAQIPYGKLGIQQLDGTLKPIDSYDERKVFYLEDDDLGGANYTEVGAARRCMPWWVIKQYVIRWWGEFADVYGEPVRVAEVESIDMPDDRRAKLERMLQSLGKNGWAIIPQDIALDLKDMSVGGNASGHTIYQNVIGAANSAYTVAVLGQTDTTEGGEGAYAKAKIQNRVRHDIMEDVSGLAEDGLEHTAKSVLSVNYGSDFEPHLAPTFEIPLPTPMDLSKKARAYNTLQKKMGLAIPARQIRDEFGIDSPSSGEAIIADGQRFDDESEYLDYMEEKQDMQRTAQEQGRRGAAVSNEGDGPASDEDASDT